MPAFNRSPVTANRDKCANSCMNEKSERKSFTRGYADGDAKKLKGLGCDAAASEFALRVCHVCEMPDGMKRA